ncbi:hypothetical protein [uncultured Winogradskyella sp.]|uniref:hypothetical protein n=1 Tax=uncultured Winogradskyella sp. TaxID=395353 RepID=UPI002634712A|nr:hypothetical protein [uncultured Winogradskyella sp.]
MIVNRILKVILLLLGGVFIVLQSFAYEVEGAAISSLMFLLLTVLYFRWTENKSSFFLWFLATFTIAQILSFAAYYLILEEGQVDYLYFITNILYIIAYIFLISRILRRLDIKKVFLEHSIPILILVVLDIFCLAIVAETTENVLSTSQNNLEYAYNAVIMALLSVALINYMYRNDNKSMLFLLASIFIVFSEIIQLAYYYILLEDNNLGFIYSFFMVVAFVFFYLQSQLEFTGPIPEYKDELEEV